MSLGDIIESPVKDILVTYQQKTHHIKFDETINEQQQLTLMENG